MYVTPIVSYSQFRCFDFFSLKNFHVCLFDDIALKLFVYKIEILNSSIFEIEHHRPICCKFFEPVTTVRNFSFNNIYYSFFISIRFNDFTWMNKQSLLIHKAFRCFIFFIFEIVQCSMFNDVYKLMGFKTGLMNMQHFLLS